MKNGELQTTDLTRLQKLYEDEEYDHNKRPIRDRILTISENLAARDRANAEAAKLKAASEEVMIRDVRAQQLTAWGPILMTIAVVTGVTICVVASIAGVVWIEGYWQYWGGK